MPKLLDFETFCEDLKEITTFKIIDKKKFHSEGLFSEQIFGPVKNYTCQCGTYHGASKQGGACKDCGVDIVNSDERRKRFAKIKLPFMVVNPIFYDLVVSMGGSNLKTALDLLMKNEKSVLYLDDGSYAVSIHPESIPSSYRTWDKLEAILELVVGFTNNMISSGSEDWKIVQENLDKLFIRNIIILPPDLRPMAKGSERNKVDKINRYYVQILTNKEKLGETVLDIQDRKDLFYDYFRMIQRDVNELYDNIIVKLSKKEGLIRGNILGKRIDFSGRAVIIPEPLLEVDECELPYIMVLELFKLQIARRLLDIGRFKLLNRAIDFVDDCIESHNPILFKICTDIVKNEVCLLNRQPTLHRLGMIGFNIKVSLSKNEFNPITSVIKIHPLACHGFNADFDGDQMAVYIPITEETKQEVREKFLMSKNFTNPANGELTARPSQDIILGIYMLTKNKFPDLQGEVIYKNTKMTEGMKIFNECLPENYPPINLPITEKGLMIILNDINDRFSEDILAQVLDNIKRKGFMYSTLYGVTMSLDSCAVDKIGDIQESIYKLEDPGDQLATISSKKIKNFLRQNFKYSYMIESGARGSWDQVRQLILTRGFISNFSGQILPTPIKHNLIDGLTPQEFFNSTYGCRKGLLDVALNTGTSGYLSRKLIFTCTNLILNPDLDDCGSTDYLEVYVADERKAEMLIFRNHLIDGKLHQITKENYQDVIGKTLLLRTPIFCKTPEICCTCYGDLHKKIRSKFIGVIAAQSLGECNTQLVLRTFHTSGVAEVDKNRDSKSALTQMDIIGDLASASKALHQFKDRTYEDIVDDLYVIYNRRRRIHHIHFECIVSQLMWYGFQKWRLVEDRDNKIPEYHSVQTVPSYESWLLGLAFSNPKRHILRGIMYDGMYHGIMDRILRGERYDQK